MPVANVRGYIWGRPEGSISKSDVAISWLDVIPLNSPGLLLLLE
jgi:hypothetical protein